VSIETAGARLKQLRLEKGISLEEVQKKTRIHLNVLRAIEGDSLSD
jgi:cytoskeletal protein RodZ